MRHKSRLPASPPNATPASPSASERRVRDIRRIVLDWARDLIRDN